MPLTSFASSQVISSSAVNANFGLCVLTDTSRTITVTHTFTPIQTFTGGFTTGASVTLGGNLLFTDATYDIGASGATRPRDLYLSRNAVFGGTLLASGAATLSSTLAVSGNLSCNRLTAGEHVIAGATNSIGWFSGSHIISPSDGVVHFKNNAESAFAALRALSLTADSGVTVTAGGLTVTGNSTITGTLTSLTGITSSGTASLATVNASALVTASGGLTTTTMTATTGIVVGSGGPTLSKVFTATIAAFDPGATVDDHERVTTTVTVTGAVETDVVIVSVVGSSPGTANTNGLFSGFVSAADTVTVAYWDQSVDSLGNNPTPVDLRVVVLRFA